MHAAVQIRMIAGILLCSVVTPALGTAVHESIAGELELYPTFHSIGARLSYSGDDNADATAYLEWRRKSAGSWVRGAAMVRITDLRWAASVLWLDPDTVFEVRAVIDDPDGGSSASETCRTLSYPDTVRSGATLWVDAEGNDDAPGDFGRPLATIQEAANRARPGDEIRVRRGVYYQTLDTDHGGRADKLIHLLADGPGVVLDGSDPDLLHRGDWRDDGERVYSIPYEGATRLVCADSLQRLYRHATLSDLRSGAHGLDQGWVVEDGRLWVKLEDGSSPVDHTMHVGRYHMGFYLDNDYWRVSGFEIRYFGAVSGTSAGISLWDADGCIITGNRIRTIGGRHILLRGMSSNVLVEGNDCRDPRIAAWPWDAVKGHQEEITAISNRGGRGVVIRSNTITGTFNGIDVRDGETNENIGADCDIHGNFIARIGDDAIETDAVSGINLRVWQNRLEDIFVGVSIAPISHGPEYVLFNTIVEYRRSGFKFSGSSSGEAWILHNTVTTSVPGRAAVHPSGPYSNIHFRNNILTASGRACVADEAGESDYGNDYDGDLVHADHQVLFQWKGTGYEGIHELRAGTGFEMAGRWGDPLFVAPEEGNYGLRPESPAIDGALRLPGVNDRFVDGAPDMGAHEYGLPSVSGNAGKPRNRRTDH